MRSLISLFKKGKKATVVFNIYLQEKTPPLSQVMGFEGFLNRLTG